ncbi:MAG TPA: ATP-binding protein [Geobacteraceae bacterium]|nr:ATP-binding protein [Geobacteraceae bacterium]
MNAKLKEILYASSLLLIPVASFFSGQGESPVRFLFFPLIVLLAFRLRSSTLLKAGFTCSMLLTLMVFSSGPPSHMIPKIAAEMLSFFLVTAATGFVVQGIEAEKGRSSKSASTFQVISDDLKKKSDELQTALDALTKAHQQLQLTNRARSRFLADVSHELRTPLTSIRSYSEILLDYDDIDDATRKEFIHTIFDESERMTLLVSKYLGLLRVGAGKSEMNITQVNPRLLIEISMNVVTPLAEKKGLPLIIELPADFPQVRGDQSQLTQVLVNLLGNAVKFTATGNITAGARQKDGMVEFFVKDTGEGIFPEEKEVIFDEFYRISGSLPNRPSGSGLGLAIARQIVEQHGGKIGVESTPGKGSTFYFTIPIFTEETAYIQPEPLPVGRETAGHLDPILVQTESIVIRQTLRKLLESMGYRTVGADTPKRGMDVSTEIRPGLIISDVMEGSGDFLKLGNWARVAGIKIILAPLYIDPANSDLVLAANGYFNKPFDRFQIVSTVEHFVTNNGRFSIITPQHEEARKLQTLLGSAGYGADLYVDEAEALKALPVTSPHAIILGSFPRSRSEDIISALKREPSCNSLPLFLLMDEGCGRFAEVVTHDSLSRRNSGKGITPLVKKIEKSLTWHNSK